MGRVKDYVVPKYVYVMWLTLVLAAGFGIFRQEWSTVFVSLLTLGASLYAIRLSRTLSIAAPPSLITAAIIFIYATLFLGEVGNFYELFWWWDMFLHTGSAVGFGLIGVILSISLFRQGKVKASPIMVSVFAFAFAMAIGAVWEIFEFVMDQTFGLSMQKSGLIDTMADLIVNCIGALIAAVSGYVYVTKGTKTPLSKVIDEGVNNT